MSQKHFTSFLEALKTPQNQSLINTILEGYDVLIESYTSGDCDVFAISLHELYGYPLYVVNGYYKDEFADDEDEYTTEPCHAVVKTTKGFLDYNGLITEEELKSDCIFSNPVEFIKIEPITKNDLMYAFGCEETPKEYITKTKQLIKKDPKYLIESIHQQSPLEIQLNNIKPQLAQTAQKIYDQWDADSDPDDGDAEVGFGGICHLIADEMADAVSKATNLDAMSNSTDYCGSPHVNIIVTDQNRQEAYIVDIDPFRYETGGGYNWKKIKDVQFDAEDVVIHKVEPENFFDENGDFIEI